MPLTDVKVRNAKPADKPLRLFDGGGLYLEVAPSGGRWWRFKYRFVGKEKRLSLGVYPDVSLKDARDKRDVLRKQLAAGVDPGEARKADKREQSIRSANTFEAIGREWWEARRAGWSASHVQATLTRLEKDLFPQLGARPLGEIEPPELLEVIRKIERRGAHETASKSLVHAGQVFRYAIATGRAQRDPSRDLRGALQSYEQQHYAALGRADMPEFLQKLEAYDGNLLTKLAIKLLLLTFVRTGELRAATWAEFDLERAMWTIPAERMKMRAEHLVPLSRQAIDVLTQLRPLSAHRPFVFPNEHKPGHKEMSENTILYALYRMGYRGRATGHGFRSTASTILNEAGYRADVIERQLAHVPRDKVRAAYNRAEHMPERREMMQAWADTLDAFAGKNIVTANFNRQASA